MIRRVPAVHRRDASSGFVANVQTPATPGTASNADSSALGSPESRDPAGDLLDHAVDAAVRAVRHRGGRHEHARRGRGVVHTEGPGEMRAAVLVKAIEPVQLGAERRRSRRGSASIGSAIR